MSARTSRQPGWVTVAAAAAALTKAGDPIDASNVSRYLARHPDVPSEKQGKFRYVDLAALSAHRNTSVFVDEKRHARDLVDDVNPRTPFAVAGQDDEDADGAAPRGSALQAANLEIKQLELRKRRRDEQVDEGRLVPVEELQAVVAAALSAFAAELSRQETLLTTRLGREVGIEIRKAHREARAAASKRLIEAATEQLHAHAAASLSEATGADVAAA